MSDAVVEQAYAFLRGHTRADLRFEENIRPIKYVIGPDGRLIAPAMVAMLRSFDLVLFIPDDSDGAMEVQVTLEEFSERGVDGAAADRWRIYHGEPDDVRWAFMQIDMARFEGMVIDGAALTQANPLAEEEAKLCTELNRQPDDLRQLCTKFGSSGGMEVESPVMVGIDPLGIDVRARFDIVRVEALQPMLSLKDARRVLATMIDTK